jgi:hypothetical protein
VRARLDSPNTRRDETPLSTSNRDREQTREDATDLDAPVSADDLRTRAAVERAIRATHAADDSQRASEVNTRQSPACNIPISTNNTDQLRVNDIWNREERVRPDDERRRRATVGGTDAAGAGAFACSPMDSRRSERRSIQRDEIEIQ